MPGKLNYVALKEYSAQFTSKILSDFYRSKNFINGQELLSLTPSKQINLGIISRIFDQWKANTQAFRSPYFNFESEEVRAAMQDFMNTVSRQISIKKEDLAPLLLEATTDALHLLLDPADYFERKLKTLPNFTYDVEWAKRLNKYTHIHPAVTKKLALRLTDSGSDFVYVNQAINWLTEIIKEGACLDPIAPYVREFSSVIPLDLATIAPDAVPLAPPILSPVHQPESKSFFETALADSSFPEPAARPASTEKSPVAPPARPLVSTMESASLNHHYKVDKPDEETNYGNIALKVDSILKSIALGHRFMFVNQLFNRNSDAFDECIRELDQASSYEHAMTLMNDTFAPKYGWDMKSEAVADLLALVKRKFN